MATTTVERSLGLPPAMTPAQLEAVMAEDRVLCVLAGAGAGKTRVLTLRVARRSDDDAAAADRTLVCTFSRKAADELRNRLYRLGVLGVTAGTIHRVALHILREWREQGSRPAPTVLGDRRPLLETVLANHNGRPDTARYLETEIGWAKARMIGPLEYQLEAHRTNRVVRLPLEVIAECFASYEEEKRRRSVLDLDDLLLESASVMEEHGAFARAQRWRFRHLYVDEMQDVNAAQFRLLSELAGVDPDLFVVGDPKQSIYGWNGADPHLLAELPGVFPGARVIRLDDNHRCSPAIVTLASAALGDETSPPRSTRTEGPIPVVVGHETDRDEARWVAREAWLAHRPGRRWSHLAVLARTNAQLRVIADALGEQRIPFCLAGRELSPASDLDGSGEDASLRGEAESGPGPSEGDDGVVLSTFHRAKGLQWPGVFVIGLSEGLVPVQMARSEAALDEERRLLYVAMTRAEDELWCSWALLGGGDERRTRRPSRWLAPIELARDEVQRAQAPAAPETVATHLAHLRSLVSRTPETISGR